MNLPNYTIQMSESVEVNTDPQRRCYNGAHFSSEVRQLPWEDLEFNVPADKLERRLKFWNGLSDYAVNQRGKGARSKYRAVENKVEIPKELT